MTRKKVFLQKIADEKSRQVAFSKRKQVLLKKAMELSVLCDCEVALIVFNTSGRLYQYSSMEMDMLLEKYSKACQEPHERRNNDELLRQHYGAKDDEPAPSVEQQRPSLPMKRSREQEQPSSAKKGNFDVVGPSGQPVVVEGIKPAGFLDKRNYPVSPKSENAYESITAEFDKLFDLNNKNAQGQHRAALPSGPMHQMNNQQQLNSGQAGAGKRFKGLSIVVPENQAAPIPPPNGLVPRPGAAGTSAGAGGGSGAGPSGLGHGSQTHLGDDGRRISDMGGSMSSQEGVAHMLNLNLPSPSGNLFGPISGDGLLSSRGMALALDLNTPDSTYNMDPVGQGFDWPSPSHSNKGGFASDQDDGGRMLDDLVVTGKSLSKLPPQQLEAAIGPEGQSIAAAVLGDDGGDGVHHSDENGVMHTDTAKETLDIPLDM